MIELRYFWSKEVQAEIKETGEHKIWNAKLQYREEEWNSFGRRVGLGEWKDVPVVYEEA